MSKRSITQSLRFVVESETFEDALIGSLGILAWLLHDLDV